ncbi:ABC transporter permease [Epilithonimonas xixisoli]|uniref:Putative ABC transport system permease protein n=1 Tax=Epilithonimonas xixisoli TaxID=1476462 RepID=A0A4R8I3F0_9FLAO|nr:ABC transporter permease [Epilithonimonas xixisoli]TDX82814.1 putative ABC transport system permease protein [Epilithonimonas xixisoli]
MLKNWLKIAFINYRKNWLSTIINILGLSVGLCVFLLIFIHWQDEKSYEDWVPNKENIYLVENHIDSFGDMSQSSYPQLYASKEKFPEIEDYTIANIWDWYKTRLIAGDNSSYSSIGQVSSQFFKFFPFETVAGDINNAMKDKSQIALSEKTAIQLFGDDYKNSIGKTVKKDQNGNIYTVSLIYKLPEKNSVFKADYLILETQPKDNDQWLSYSFFGLFKLKPGTDVQKLEAKLSKQQAEQEEILSKKWGAPFDKNKPAKVYLTPITKIKLDAKGDGILKGDKKSLKILLGLSILILMLTGINLINLKTAQSAQRAKEVGVRKVVGSSKTNLIFQFLIETFIICLVAYLVALALLELLLPSYNQYLGKQIKLNDPDVFIGSGLLLIVFALFAGIIPSVYLSNFKPINTLKGNFSRSKQGVWLRNFILTLQLVISSFFIICSLIIHLQVKFMMKKELGFKGNQVIQIDFKKTNYNEKDYDVKKYELLRNEVRKIPGVVATTGSVQSLGMGLRNASSAKNAADTTKVVNNVALGGMEENYFKFYDMKIVAGRNLDWRKASDTINGTVINETFAKKMGWSNQQAIGKEILPGWEDKKKYKILGVVKDFYYGGVDKPIESASFYNYQRNWSKNSMTNLQIKIDANDINGTLERIKEFWTTKAEPGYPYDYNFVDKQFAKTFEKFQKQQTLFTTLNIVVLVIALLGLFALSSLLIEQKLKDVAIKKTLGADERTIVWDLTKRFLLICVIAVFISIPFGYYAMNEWLKDFAYRIDMPVWPYVLSMILLLILTFAVVSFKAYRATKINLVKYLKYE